MKSKQGTQDLETRKYKNSGISQGCEHKRQGRISSPEPKQKKSIRKKRSKLSATGGGIEKEENVATINFGGNKGHTLR